MKFLFSCSTQHLTSEVNTRREIRYPRAPIYYSLYVVMVAVCLKCLFTPALRQT